MICNCPIDNYYGTIEELSNKRKMFWGVCSKCGVKIYRLLDKLHDKRVLGYLNDSDLQSDWYNEMLNYYTDSFKDLSKSTLEEDNEDE